MKKSILLISIFTFSLFTFRGVSNAQDKTTKVGTTAGNFLLIEVGAKAIGMGGAFVGVADDASTLYWNPAGTALLKRPTAQYQISKRFAGITQHFAGLSFPLSSSDNLGLLIDYLSVGDMNVTTIQQPEGTGQTFSASDLAIGLNYARQLTDRVSVGFTFKYIYEKIWLEYAQGFAIDLGTVYNIEEKGIRIGMNIVNLGPDMGIDGGPHLSFYKRKPDDFPGSPQPEANLATETFPLPLSFSLGVSTVILGRNSVWLQNADHRVQIAVGANDSFDAPFRANVGMEYSWKGLLSLRGGYRINYDTQKYSVGFGIDFSKFSTVNLKLDYVWVDYGDLNSINVWSLEFVF